jgi:post-segregation antitoxin (ccd killing protein)
MSGKNVAVDGSTVTATNNYSVNLSGSAMQNATAINIVNAAGGMVANGVNVARIANTGISPTLTQSNTVSQIR